MKDLIDLEELVRKLNAVDEKPAMLGDVVCFPANIPESARAEFARILRKNMDLQQGFNQVLAELRLTERKLAKVSEDYERERRKEVSMFKTSRKKLLAGLAQVNKRLCDYGQGLDLRGYCDCKYGINDNVSYGSEQNGCPEVRLCRFIF